ncbi:MAG TPA: PadR family transcriptional regulator [Gemmatimonadaceae bacterium]|nr:PadR family transcriptional regulator [Gemmatimonadaceae bacterium]
MTPGSAPLLKGTLDLIVLQLLRAEPTNGFELAQRIHTISRDVLHVNAGSLYPALYRLEARDLIRAEWEESKTGRRVKVYSLTASGRRQLQAQREDWRRFAGALASILEVR